MRAWVRPAAAIAVAAVAGYFLVTNTLAFVLPGPLAHAAAPWSGVADGKLAEMRALQSRSLADAPGVVAAARATLEREPYDFRAARSLASVDALTGKAARAQRTFTLIGRHTLREPYTHLQLLNHAFLQKDNAGIVREAETLLRQRPQMAAQVYPFLVYLVDNRLAWPQLIQRLNETPAWRGGFLSALGEQSTKSDMAYAFLRLLRAGPRPATAAELRVWLLHEVGRTDGDVLVQRWKSLQQPALPAREALLRNPDFEGSVAPPPFDWTFFAPEGSFAEIGSSPTGQGKALFVEMVGREDVTVATQMLDLAPGEYVLRSRLYPVSDTGRREAAIDVTCARGKLFEPLARQPLDAPTDTWSAWQMRFTVSAGCRTQRLSIGMRPGALTAEQRMYFDDMILRRVR